MDSPVQKAIMTIGQIGKERYENKNFAGIPEDTRCLVTEDFLRYLGF